MCRFILCWFLSVCGFFCSFAHTSIFAPVKPEFRAAPVLLHDAYINDLWDFYLRNNGTIAENCDQDCGSYVKQIFSTFLPIISSQSCCDRVMAKEAFCQLHSLLAIIVCKYITIAGRAKSGPTAVELLSAVHYNSSCLGILKIIYEMLGLSELEGKMPSIKQFFTCAATQSYVVPLLCIIYRREVQAPNQSSLPVNIRSRRQQLSSP